MRHFAKIFLAIISCLFIKTQAAGYDGYKIYEITPATSSQCDLLNELSKDEQNYDFLALSKIPKRPAILLIAPKIEPQLLSYLKAHAFENYRVINENVGNSIELEFNKNRLLRSLTPFTGKGRLSTERYYTHAEINNYIEDLAQRYPKRAYVKTVGKSYEGRLIKTLTITNGDGRANKKVFFVDGGFHAREWISPAAVLYVIEQLVERFEENADLLKEHDWVILPVVNPDGYEFTQTSVLWRMWRKTRQHYQFMGVNCNGADPNRNFDFHWNEDGASSWVCSEMYAGPKAFSEPEAVIVRDLMHTLGERGVMYLTVHSWGSFMLYPWGWTTDLPDTWEDLDEVGRAGADAIFNATGEVYTVGTSTNVLYIAAGASDDYGYISGFPISITMELPRAGLTGFDPPASQIDFTVKESWIGILAMAKKVIEKY